MKTLAIVKYDLGGFLVPIRTDGMYCATEFEKMYNATKNVTAPEKRFDKYLATESAKEYIEYLNNLYANKPENQIVLNTQKSGELKMVNNKAIAKSIIDTKRGRHHSGTFICEDLFVDFAQWLSVEYKHWAIQLVRKKIGEMRELAGDGANELKAAISKCYENRPSVIVYKREFDMLNEAVFGVAGRNQRENATDKQLSLLNKLQKFDTSLLLQGEEAKPFEQRKREIAYLVKAISVIE